MPNWTQNTITVTGKPDDLRAFLEAVKWEDELFDFNRLIPMPDLLKHTGDGSCTIDGQVHTAWYVVNPAERDPRKTIVRAFTPEEQAQLKEIGHNSWYYWSIENWGTKWNACQVHIDDLGIASCAIEIDFRTAWSAPLPIFHKMHEMFPHLSFKCEWRNEDDGWQEHFTLELEAAA
jgi:hypothetical protein